MTTLAPMRPECFDAFAARSVANYAHESVASFRWDDSTAHARAREQFARLLPQGMATPGHHFCEILAGPAGKQVGELWYEISGQSQSRYAYLWDIYIDVDARREHHAKAALRALEDICRVGNVQALGLQVFAHNAVAQALYTSLGFSVTGFNMIKQIA